MYKIEFYNDPENGNTPVQEYLDSLDDKTSGFISEMMSQLAETGHLPHPYTSHVESDVRELRFSKKGKRPRILYARVIGRRILLLHGFTKTTKKLPLREKSIALERLEEFMLRPENKRYKHARKKKR